MAQWKNVKEMLNEKQIADILSNKNLYDRIDMLYKGNRSSEQIAMQQKLARASSSIAQKIVKISELAQQHGMVVVPSYDAKTNSVTLGFAPVYDQHMYDDKNGKADFTKMPSINIAISDKFGSRNMGGRKVADPMGYQFNAKGNLSIATSTQRELDAVIKGLQKNGSLTKKMIDASHGGKDEGDILVKSLNYTMRGISQRASTYFNRMSSQAKKEMNITDSGATNIMLKSGMISFGSLFSQIMDPNNPKFKQIWSKKVTGGRSRARAYDDMRGTLQKLRDFVGANLGSKNLLEMVRTNKDFVKLFNFAPDAARAIFETLNQAMQIGAAMGGISDNAYSADYIGTVTNSMLGLEASGASDVHGRQIYNYSRKHQYKKSTVRGRQYDRLANASGVSASRANFGEKADSVNNKQYRIAFGQNFRKDANGNVLDIQTQALVLAEKRKVVRYLEQFKKTMVGKTEAQIMAAAKKAAAKEIAQGKIKLTDDTAWYGKNVERTLDAYFDSAADIDDTELLKEMQKNGIANRKTDEATKRKLAARNILGRKLHMSQKDIAKVLDLGQMEFGESRNGRTSVTYSMNNRMGTMNKLLLGNSARVTGIKRDEDIMDAFLELQNNELSDFDEKTGELRNKSRRMHGKYDMITYNPRMDQRHMTTYLTPMLERLRGNAIANNQSQVLKKAINSISVDAGGKTFEHILQGYLKTSNNTANSSFILNDKDIEQFVTEAVMGDKSISKAKKNDVAAELLGKVYEKIGALFGDSRYGIWEAAQNKAMGGTGNLFTRNADGSLSTNYSIIASTSANQIKKPDYTSAQRWGYKAQDAEQRSISLAQANTGVDMSTYQGIENDSTLNFRISKEEYEKRKAEELRRRRESQAILDPKQLEHNARKIMINRDWIDTYAKGHVGGLEWDGAGITEESYNQSIMPVIEEAVKERLKELQKTNPELTANDLDVVLDLGKKVKEKVTVGDETKELAGRMVHLNAGELLGRENKDGILMNTPQFLGTVIKYAQNIGEWTDNGDTLNRSNTFADLLEQQYDNVNYKFGSVYAQAHEKEMERSMSGHLGPAANYNSGDSLVDRRRASSAVTAYVGDAYSKFFNIDAAQKAGETSAEYVERLQKTVNTFASYYDQAFGKDSTYDADKIARKILTNEELEKETDPKKLIEQAKALRNYVIKSATIGDELFKENGILVKTGRYPYINDQSIRHNRLYFGGKDQGLAEGKMQLGSGTAKRIRADFDGDEIHVTLGIGDDTKRKHSIKELNAAQAQEEALTSYEDMRHEGVAKLLSEKDIADELDSSLPTAKEKDLKLITDISNQIKAQYIAKENKTQTGRFDLLRQNMLNTLTDAGAYNFDPKDPDSVRRALDAMGVNSIMELLSQESISSKKTVERFASKSGNKGLSQGELVNKLFTEIDELREMLTSGKAFENLGSFYKKLEGTGLVDKDKGFADTLTTDMLSNTLYTANGRRYLARLAGKSDAEVDAKNKDYLTKNDSLTEEQKIELGNQFFKEILGGKASNIFNQKWFETAFTRIGNFLSSVDGYVMRNDHTWVGTGLGAAENLRLATMNYAGALPGNTSAETSPATLIVDGAADVAGGLEGLNSAIAGFATALTNATNAVNANSAAQLKYRTTDQMKEQLSNVLNGTADGKHPYGFAATTVAGAVTGRGDLNSRVDFAKTVLANGASRDNFFGFGDQKTFESQLQGYIRPTQGTVSGRIAADVATAQKYRKLIEKKSNFSSSGIDFNILENGTAAEMVAMLQKIGEFTKNSRNGGLKDLSKEILGWNLIPNKDGTDHTAKERETAKGLVAVFEEFDKVLKLTAEDAEKVTETLDTRARLQVANDAKMRARGAILTTTEGRTEGVAPDGTYLYGYTDFAYSDVNEKGEKVYRQVDAKNPDKQISLGNLLQQYVYDLTAKQRHKAIKDAGSLENYLATDIGKSHATGMGGEKSRAFLDDYQALADAKEVVTEISAVNKEGQQSIVRITANLAQEMNIVNTMMRAWSEGRTLTNEEKNFAMGGAAIVDQNGIASKLDATDDASFVEVDAEFKKLLSSRLSATKKVTSQQKAIAGMSPSAANYADEKAILEVYEQQAKAIEELIQKKLESLETSKAEKEVIDAYNEANSESLKVNDDLLAIGGHKASGTAALFKEQRGLAALKRYKQATLGSAEIQGSLYKLNLQKNTSIYPGQKEAIDVEISRQQSQLEEYNDEMVRARTEAEALGVAQNDLNKVLKEGTSRYQKIANAADIQNKGAHNLWQQLGNSFKSMMYNFTQMNAAYRIIGKIRTSVQKLVQYAVQLDKVMTNLRIVTGDNYETAQKLVNGYSKLAQQLSVTTTEVATSANEWLRQGYSVSETNDLISSSMKLSTLGMMNSSSATQALTSAMKGFNIEAANAITIVDKFTNLDMHAATSAGDIATALARFATTAKQSGVDIDQASAMATTIMDVSQQDAGSVGSALKTILSRFGNVKAGAYTNMGEGDSDDTTEKINDVERVLSKLGIEVRASARDMRDFGDVLDDIAEKWGTLDTVSKNAISTAMAGTRQRESFNVLMENYDKYKELVETSKNSDGTADKKYLAYQERLEASQKRLQAAWENLANSSEINTFLTTVNNMLSFAVNSLPVIIRYLARVLAITNAYKIPAMFSTMKTALIPSIRGSKWTIGGQTKLGMGVNGSGQSNTEKLIDFVFPRLGKAVEETTTAMNNLANATNGAAGGGVKNSTKQSGKTFQEQISGMSSKELQNEINRRDQDISAMTSSNADFSKRLNKANESLANAYSGDDEMSDEEIALSRDKKRYEVSIQANNKGIEQAQAEKKMLQQQKDVVDKQTLKTRGLAGVAGAISGGLTATHTAKNWSTGEDQQMSAAAATTSSIMGAAAGALSAINPIVGMVATMASDLLNKYLIGPLIDREANERKARVDNAEKVSQGLSQQENTIQNFFDYAKKDMLSVDDYKAMNKEVQNFLTEMYKSENETTRKALEEALREETGDSSTTLYGLMQEYELGGSKDRQRIARQLQTAEYQSKANADYVAYEQKRYDQQKSLRDNEAAEWVDGLEFAKIIGAEYSGYLSADSVITNKERQDAPEKSQRSDSSKNYRTEYQNFLTNGKHFARMSYDDQLFAIAKYQDYMKQNNMEVSEMNDKLEQLKKSVEDIQAQTEQMYKEMNRTYVASAMVNAQNDLGSYLTDMTNLQLKNLGPDAIREAVADALVESGGLMGHNVRDADGNITTYALNLINEALKVDSQFSGVITGNSYTLSDVQKMGDGKTRQALIESFASALNLTAKEVADMLSDPDSGLVDLFKSFGDMTLGDLIKTPAETREEIEALSSLFDSIASSTGLTAENIETIVTKYPELVKYIGDQDGLNSAIIKDLENYKKSYALKTYNSIAENEGVFEQYTNDIMNSSDLSEDQKKKLRGSSLFGNASTIKDILAMINGNPDDFGIDKETQEALKKQYEELFDGIDTDKIVDQKIATTMSSYLEKIYDKQIKNLEEQKDALENINKQREYENKLIEAKNKLEDAAKKKKRVWRDGVGWVYESDQNALKEAQENLDSVSNEKKISELELQIQQLTTEKETLTNLASEEELKNLKSTYDAWIESNEGVLTDLATIRSEIGKMYSGEGSTGGESTGGATEVAANSVAGQAATATATASADYDEKQKASANLGSLYQNFKDAKDAMEKEGQNNKGSTAYRDAEQAYNDALAAFQSGAKDSEGSTGYNEFFDNNSAAKQALSAPGSSDYIPQIVLNGKPYIVSGEGGPNYKHVQDDFNSKHGGLVFSDVTENKGANGRIDSYTVTGNGQRFNADAMGDKNNSIDYFATDSAYPEGTVLLGDKGSDEYLVKHGKRLFNLKAAATGSLGLPGGLALLNEKGTEAIITPAGTITTEPSGTGVVPADITKNLWALGEQAPLLTDWLTGGKISNSTDDSLNIGVLNMSITPNGDFDVDSWVNQIKNAVALSKNRK